VAGPVPIKLNGRVADDRENRLMVEADLTAAKIENLLPGWLKLPGRPMRATFTLIKGDSTTRFEDIAVDGSGAMLRGMIEIDAANDLQTVSFPTFTLSEGDKANLKADRGTDGALRVMLRGDVFDGRSFVKTSISGSPNDAKQKPQRDLDLDVKVSRVL